MKMVVKPQIMLEFARQANTSPLRARELPRPPITHVSSSLERNACNHLGTLPVIGAELPAKAGVQDRYLFPASRPKMGLHTTSRKPQWTVILALGMCLGA